MGRALLNIYFPKPILMSANYKIAKFLAALSLLFLSPFFLQGQCAPWFNILNQRIVLIYPDDSSTPYNLQTIDVNMESGTIGTDYAVKRFPPTWQTLDQGFVAPTLTGTITIHYIDSSTDICDYVNGIYNDPLPIELSVFNGHLMGNDVFLTWSTESESDNAGFEIERSFDGDNFERIASINGAGNSNEKVWYSFEDFDVKNTALGDAVYYRLKQINYDQTYWYSWVVAVDLKFDIQGFEITKILGWNNPDRIVKIYFHNPADIRKINITVATIDGQIIEQKSIYPQKGFNFFEIDLSNQKEQLFFISLNNGKQITVEKLILQPID